MTLNEIAYRLFESYRANIKDSDPIDIRLIKNWVRSKRAKLLKQSFDKSLVELSDANTQILGGVEMECIDSSIMEDLPSGCSLYRSMIDIPTTIDRRNIGHSFKRIGPADRLTSKYDILSFENAIKFGNGRFNLDNIISFILDNKIYLYSKGNKVFMPQYIDVIGVFEDAMVAGIINDSDYDDDSRYPLSESLIDDLEAMILDGNFKIMVKQQEDKVEDNEHNPE